jgi:hypothetical protein
MAHFSAILLFEQVRGEKERRELCKRLERDYTEHRQVDSEKPLARTLGEKSTDVPVIYDKGGWVFWMLHRLMGREASLEGIQDFLRRYVDSRDFPVLQDYVRVLREHVRDLDAFDAFVQQWFFEVVLPEYRITEAQRAARNEGVGGGWVVTATVENVGTGRMPVQVAAGGSGGPEEGAGEARVPLTLGAGERGEVEIPCDFEPERLVVDPDVEVLMLGREEATRRLQ